MFNFAIVFFGLISLNFAAGDKSPLYPWGVSNGDLVLASNSIISRPNQTELNLALFVNVNFTLEKFTLFNTLHSDVTISKQGFLSFSSGHAVYVALHGFNTSYLRFSSSIVPFLGEVDPFRGFVFYRETVTKSLLQLITTDIKRAFPALKNLNAEWAFITTFSDLTFWEPEYYRSAANCNCLPRTNTFQAVIVKAGTRSFTIFNYEKLSWARSPWKEWVGREYTQGCNVIYEQELSNVASFTFGDNQREPYFLEGSFTDSIINLTKNSNINPQEKGKWVFKVDKDLISPTCDAGNEIEQIRIYPNYICHLGHVPLKILGPCFSDVKSVECKFYDGSLTTPLSVKGEIEDVELTCRAPLLQTTGGRVRLEIVVSYNQPIDVGLRADKTFFGWVFTHPPYWVGSHALEFQIKNDGLVHVTWDPSVFQENLKPSSSLLLQLTMVVVDFSQMYSKKHSELPETTLKMSVFNNGSYNWFLGSSGIFRNPKAGYFAYLTTLNEMGDVYLHSPMVYTSLSATKERYAELCEEWHRTDPGLSEGLPLCPPLQEQASWDWNFVRDSSYFKRDRISFRQRVPSTGGSCQRCDYVMNNTGMLILSPPSGGTADLVCSDRFLSHQMKDVLPYHWCFFSGSLDHISKYYEKRTVSTGAGVGYRPPSFGFIRGDPHITTLDNVTYTFNPVGEFWMIKGTLDSPKFEMQARMSQYKLTNASVFTAFAMRQMNPIVDVQVTLEPTGIHVWANKEEIEADLFPSKSEDPALISVPGASISLTRSLNGEIMRVTLSFSSGYGMDIRKAGDEPALNLMVSASSSLKGKASISGLLGNFDGNPNNDLQYPSPSPMTTSPNASLQNINRFGLEWRTVAKDSLFIYLGGKEHANYQDVNFTPNLKEINASGLPKQVQDLCEGVKECLYDYATTGSIAMSKATKDLANTVQDVVEDIFKRKAPVPCQHPSCSDLSTQTPRPTRGSSTTPGSGPGSSTKKPSSAVAMISRRGKPFFIPIFTTVFLFVTVFLL